MEQDRERPCSCVHAPDLYIYVYTHTTQHTHTHTHTCDLSLEISHYRERCRICVCVCVCVLVCVYVCTYCRWVRARVCVMCVCKHICLYVCMYVCVRTHVLIFNEQSNYIGILVFKFTNVCTPTHTLKNVYVSANYFEYTYTHLHTTYT